MCFAAMAALMQAQRHCEVHDAYACEAIVHSKASPEVGANSPPFKGLAYSAPGACQRSGRNLSGSSKLRQVLWIACAYAA